MWKIFLRFVPWVLQVKLRVEKGISCKMGFELEFRHLSSSLASSWYLAKRRGVACLYNEIIKMSPNTLESGSVSSFCFTSDSLLGGKSHFQSSPKIYFYIRTTKSFTNDFHVENGSTAIKWVYFAWIYGKSGVCFKFPSASVNSSVLRKDSVPFSARIEIEL